MTTSEQRLSILLTLRDRATTGLKRFTRGVQENRKKIGLSFTAMAAAGILAGRSVVNAALEQQRAEKTLAATVEKTGASWASQREKVLAATAALQAKTNFGDEEQLRALSKMVPILGDVDKALAALPAVLDAASSSGLGMESIAGTLSRALGGMVNQSLSTGIQFDKTSDFGERLQTVLSKVGGSAEANVDPMKQMSNTVGDLKEKIGTALLPTLIPLFVQVGKLATIIGAWAEENEKLLRFIAPIIVGLVGLAAVIGPLLLILPGLILAIKGVGIALTFLAANPVVLIIAAIALLAVGIFLLVKNWDTVWARIKQTTATVIDFVKSKLNIILLFMGPAGLLIAGIIFFVKNWEAIWQTIKDVVSSAVSFITDGVNSAIALINKIPGIAIGEEGGESGLTAGSTGVRQIRERSRMERPGMDGGGGTVVNVNIPANSAVFLDNEQSRKRLAKTIATETDQVNRGRSSARRR